MFPNQNFEFQTNIGDRFHCFKNMFGIGHNKLCISKHDVLLVRLISKWNMRSAMMTCLWLSLSTEPNSTQGCTQKCNDAGIELQPTYICTSTLCIQVKIAGKSCHALYCYWMLPQL
ncbi:hypothetical protein PR048_011401 [Dryococelus australis]|uniref:Uncharacterized protein n=1 Tax=Dryococelus australis TaxID=614101 RepID=A0ABQ9HM00_9NEOP|nr:hypothetical protein PR048_011401 [Dryococelus australis]